MPGLADLDAVLRAAANPFADSALRNAHESLHIDVTALQAEIFHDLVCTVERARLDGRSRLQLVQGDPGEGKTHLLSRLRRRAERSWADRQAEPFAVGIVAPLRDPGRPFLHLLREAVASLSRPSDGFLGGAGADLQPDSQLERLGWMALARGLAYLGGRDPHFSDWGQDQVPRYLGSFAARLRDEWPEHGASLQRRLAAWAEQAQIAPELWRALCLWPVPGAAQTARAWIRGALLPEAELQAHGLPPPIEDEDTAFRVLVSLSRMSGLPLVLGFDQVEGIRRQGEDAVLRFFAALVELFNQDGPLVQLVLCQTSIWAELRQRVEQQVLDRLERSLRLAPLTPDEVVALCAGRLAPVWRDAGLVPPYPTYPFAPEDLRRMADGGSAGGGLNTPRQVLRYLGQALPERLRKERPSSQVFDARGFYQEVLERKQRQVFDRSPEVRAAMVQHALQRGLAAAHATGEELGGARVLRVEPRVAQKGQEGWLLLVLSRGGSDRRVHLAATNSLNGQSATATVRRMAHVLQRGEADLGLLLRERALPLPPSALDLLKKTPGGDMVWLSAEELPAFAALEAFLNAAPDHEIAADEAERLCAAIVAGLPAVGQVLERAFAVAALPAGGQRRRATP